MVVVKIMISLEQEYIDFLDSFEYSDRSKVIRMLIDEKKTKNGGMNK